jgi:hypothetical protein
MAEWRLEKVRGTRIRVRLLLTRSPKLVHLGQPPARVLETDTLLVGLIGNATSASCALCTCSWTEYEQQGENDVLGALSGFGLDSVLGSLDLPSGTGLSSQLGIGGVRNIADAWDDDGAVGQGEGDDWEDEITAELAEEDVVPPGAWTIKAEEPQLPEIPLFSMKERRVRVVRRLVERPKTVYERFPGFERDRTLAFTEMFQGHAARKSRVSKRPFHGVFPTSPTTE